MEEENYFEECIDDIHLARWQLRQSAIVDGFYSDRGYVSAAACNASFSLKKAGEWYLLLNNYEGELTSVNDIIRGLRKIDNRAKNLFYDGYTMLYTCAYNHKITNVSIIKAGLKCATAFINLLKPYKIRRLEHYRSMKFMEDPPGDGLLVKRSKLTKKDIEIMQKHIIYSTRRLKAKKAK